MILHEIVQFRINLNDFAHVAQLCVNATRKYVNLRELMQHGASLCICFVIYFLCKFECICVQRFR